MHKTDPRDAAARLIERVTGHSHDFILQIIPDEGGADVFEVGDDGGRVVLRGNNGVALATAFNHYLKYTAHQFFAYAGPDRVALPMPLPAVTEPVRVVFPHKFRHYFNNEDCEYAYTANLFDQAQWHRRLDWMAMNGINMFTYSFTTGPVWLAMAGKLGLRQEHIDRLGGRRQPMSSRDDRQKPLAMARFVARQAFEMGIEPEFRPFYGLMPDIFTGNDMTGTFFEGKQVLTGSSWLGFPGPRFFGPGDGQLDAFNQLAQWYYQAQREVYGLNEYGAVQSYFIGDCFNESGLVIVHPDYPTEQMVKRFEAAMLAYNPRATWVSSAWRLNKEVFDAYDPDHFLVIDLECDYEEKWRETEAFWGKQWLWGLLHNFGGNNGLSGSLDVIANGPADARRDPNAGAMSGVAIAPEGGETNPVVYDLMGEMSWRCDAPDVAQWLRQYARRRYGRTDAAMDDVWRILRHTVYSKVVKQGPHQTLVAARPRLSGRCIARHCGVNEIPYPPQDLIPAWSGLLQIADRYTSQSYLYDLVDVGRQVLADYALAVYGRIRAAWDRGDAAGFAAACDDMLALCADMDALVATRPEYLLGLRLASARDRGATPAHQDRCELGERTLLTIWVHETPGNDHLEDYCNRLYAGLIGDYYRARWQLLREHGLAALAGGQPLDEAALDAALNAFSLDFTRQKKAYPTEPVGDAVAVSRALHEKYLPVLTAAYTV